MSQSLSSGLQINQPAISASLTVTAQSAATTCNYIVQQQQAVFTSNLTQVENAISQAVNSAASQGLYQCTVDVSSVTALNKSNPTAAQQVITQLNQDLTAAGFQFPPISFGTGQVIISWAVAVQTLQQANQTQQQVLNLIQ